MSPPRDAPVNVDARHRYVSIPVPVTVLVGESTCSPSDPVRSRSPNSYAAAMSHRVVDVPTELESVPTVVVNAQARARRVPSVFPDVATNSPTGDVCVPERSECQSESRQ